MFDFSVLQANADNPTLMSVVYAMLFAFLLSVLVAFTYEKTSRDLFVPGNFLQAMILGSMAAATVMLAIGDSLARGLGMIGALAIIHFRTNLRDPRNIIFMFASLAVGIASGVHAYNTAFMGTVAFCIVAFLLRLTPFSMLGITPSTCCAFIWMPRTVLLHNRWSSSSSNTAAAPNTGAPTT
ncbi:MAG: DUF4956 domain-containing protein [Saprospiraceae bacterium]|nr:DUF4956 domain-containing protein [Saprospiraceae bacterium]